MNQNTEQEYASVIFPPIDRSGKTLRKQSEEIAHSEMDRSAKLKENEKEISVEVVEDLRTYPID